MWLKTWEWSISEKAQFGPLDGYFGWKGMIVCEYNYNLLYIYIYTHTHHHHWNIKNVLQPKQLLKTQRFTAPILRICRRFREVPRLWRLARRPSQLTSLTSLTWCPSSRHVRTHLMRTHPWSFLTLRMVLEFFFVEGGWRCCVFLLNIWHFEDEIFPNLWVKYGNVERLEKDLGKEKMSWRNRSAWSSSYIGLFFGHLV